MADLIAALLPELTPLVRPVTHRRDESALHRRCLRCIERAPAAPYAAPLALQLLVALDSVSARTAFDRLDFLARTFDRIFDAFNLLRFSDFYPDSHLAAALEGRLPRLSRGSAVHAVKCYRAAVRDQQVWLDLQPADVRSRSAALLLPTVDFDRLFRHAPPLVEGVSRQDRLERDAESLVRRYGGLQGVADERLTFLAELTELAATPRDVEISGFGGRHRFGPPPGNAPVGFLRHLGSHDGAAPWFIELLSLRLLSRRPSEEGRRWLSDAGLRPTHFLAYTPGVLRQPRRCKGAAYCGSVFTPTPLLAAAQFGSLALRLLLDRGSRVRELRQFSVDRDRTVPTPGGGVAFAALLKGGVMGRIPVSPATVAAALEVVRFLRRHYCLDPRAPLPIVPFDLSDPRDEELRLPPARYLFQYRRRQLDSRTINACVRFLLHGIAGDTNLRCHLFRHAYAKIGLSSGHTLASLGREMYHRNPSVTWHYARPPLSSATAYIQAILSSGDE